MELFLSFALPCLLGILLAILFCFIRQRQGHSLPWPTFFFAAALGAAANNTCAVWFTDTWAFLPSGGFFGGDKLTAGFTGLIMAAFALSGLASCLLLGDKGTGTSRSASAYLWSWVLTQSALSVFIFFTGVFVGFRSLPHHDGLPLAAYVLLAGVLLFGLGFLSARKIGRPGRTVPLLGLAVFSAMTAMLLVFMTAQARDPSDGLSLVQTDAGMWYTRFNLPAALLIGDYQYVWEITPPGLWLSALAPHLLFTAGYLTAGERKRGNHHV